MEYVKLGNSDLNVSRICLGCMGFGDASIGHSIRGPLARNRHVRLSAGRSTSA